MSTANRWTVTDEHRLRGSWQLGPWQGAWRAERLRVPPVPTDSSRPQHVGTWFAPGNETWRLRLSTIGVRNRIQ